jgi:hypothetical protein
LRAAFRHTLADHPVTFEAIVVANDWAAPVDVAGLKFN